MRQQVRGGTQVTSLHPVQALYIQYTVRSDVSKAKVTREQEGEIIQFKVLKVKMVAAGDFISPCRDAR